MSQRIGLDSAHLTFDASEPEEVTVHYRAGDAEVSVCAYDTPSGLSHLAEFFRDLADDWKGWDGQRRWSSLEGHVELVATHNRVVILDFNLSPQRFGRDQWHLSGSVEIEPGEELSSIVHGMDALFGR